MFIGNGSLTNEVSAGAGGFGIFASKKTISDGSTTNVGIKASVSTPEVKKTTTTFTMRLATILEDKKRNK